MRGSELRIDDPRIRNIARRFRECRVYTTNFCIYSLAELLRIYAPPEVKIHCEEPIPDWTNPEGMWDLYRRHHKALGETPIEFDPQEYEELGGLLIELVGELDELKVSFGNKRGVLFSRN